MKRFIFRILWFLVLVFALSSIGAKTGCSTPTGTQSNQDPPKHTCLMDPPVGCAAYCQDVDVVAFTPPCTHISAGELELLFEVRVMTQVQELEAQGTQVCPQSNLSTFVTPCDVGITPQEWPAQDHEVCAPVPPGCPL